ncbi:hypothetical protein Tco_0786157, partial [Tanacetum coccineum]
NVTYWRSMQKYEGADITSMVTLLLAYQCLGDGKGSRHNSIIHDAPSADLHSLTKDFAKKIGDIVDLYVLAMEKLSVYT